MKRDLSGLKTKNLHIDNGIESAVDFKRKQFLLVFLQKNWVVIIAVLLAVITCFLVPPDKEYLKYPSYKTLACLFCMILVLRGLKDTKIFGIISGKILDRISDRRLITMVLVFLPAVFALFITNDVATLTFVPFTIILLMMANCKELINKVIILQTMAVKLSGTLSPIGTAQNLFLIDYYGFDFLWFIKNLWPLALCGYALVFIGCMTVKRGDINVLPIGDYKIPKRLITAYLIMFLFIMLAVFDVLPYYVIAPIILVFMLILHKRSYRKANYSIIIMFLAFFIIAGNFQRIPAVDSFLTQFLAGREFVSAVVASQVFTNTPVALLFPKFSTDTLALLYGINVGKYGTSILSNFIVYRLVRKYDDKHNFLPWLMIVNLIFLLALAGVGMLYLSIV